MVAAFQDAFAQLKVPEALTTRANAEGGYPLYLSGGGFRGWGYLLLHMSQTIGTGMATRTPGSSSSSSSSSSSDGQSHRDESYRYGSDDEKTLGGIDDDGGGTDSPLPHPISIINGYTVDKNRFADTDAMQRVARTAPLVFRVSDRRRKQVPAVAFLVNVLNSAIPHGGIRTAHFCQGGVREGYLFRELPPVVRQEDPLEVATRTVAPPSARALCSLLLLSFPEPEAGLGSRAGPRATLRKFPDAFGLHVIRAFVNMLYVHAVMDKELASASALYSTSTGLLASTRGVSHEDRARLALLLESRYMGELPPRELQFREALRRVITPEEVWWAAYLGRVGYMLARLYPAGAVDESKPRLALSSDWASDLGKKRSDKEGLRLTISLQRRKHDPTKLKQALREHVGVVEKVGKKKNWIGGPQGWGMAVAVKVVEEDIL